MWAARSKSRCAEACRPRSASPSPRATARSSTPSVRRFTALLTGGAAAPGSATSYACGNSCTAIAPGRDGSDTYVPSAARQRPGRPSASLAAVNTSSGRGPCSGSTNTIPLMATIPIRSIRMCAFCDLSCERPKVSRTWRRALSTPSLASSAAMSLSSPAPAVAMMHTCLSMMRSAPTDDCAARAA